MKQFLGNILLALLGLAIALIMAEMLMRAFPNLVPRDVRVNPPARRVKPFVDETYDLRQSDGDLFHHMRGHIVPLSPDDDQVVAHVHMVTDANGFRNSPPEKATYEIVALGDSFTRASGVASAWPQLVAEQTGSDVLNLGDVGFGPQDELKVLQQYGLQKKPKWVILAYFEGNDLHDASSYDQATPFILARLGRFILNRNLKALDEDPGEVEVAVAPNYRYPITASISNQDLQLAFFSYYVSWLSVDRESIESSRNYGLVTETILRMRNVTEEEEARFLLVYVPSKEHVYLPYLNDTDLEQRVFVDVPTVQLDEAGFLQFTAAKATPELIRQHMDDQSNVMAAFAQEHEIPFLDLTSTFRDEAGRGALLYYTYDTHWNQQGHDLAADTIAEFIEDMQTSASYAQP
jgi:hypothetical protein